MKTLEKKQFLNQSDRIHILNPRCHPSLSFTSSVIPRSRKTGRDIPSIF